MPFVVCRKLAFALLLIGACASGACASEPPRYVAPFMVLPSRSTSSGGGKPAPDWVMRTPRMSGNVCAVGCVDPTFYRQDAMKNAAEAARNELARTVESKINSMLLDVAENDGSWVRQVIDSTTDVVVNGAEVLEYWYDSNGSVQRQGMTFALACMKTDQSAANLAAKLKEVSADDPAAQEQKIAKVRERAAAAFDELEAAEAKKP